ncbi:hypothetical protein KDX31_19340 [Amphritea atlantica]|uniref:Uncharacterized protein n=1 Tax=Amphritea atlantica TaxID=355243 RepID=A0ABY5GTW5_9GAMM|nr:hypothetical protein KDX31_19340 [Amphritea atlantica]
MSIKFLSAITLGLVVVSSSVFSAGPTLNDPYSGHVMNNSKVNSSYGIHDAEMRSMSMSTQSVDKAMSHDMMAPVFGWDADSSR